MLPALRRGIGVSVGLAVWSLAGCSNSPDTAGSAKSVSESRVASAAQLAASHAYTGIRRSYDSAFTGRTMARTARAFAVAMQNAGVRAAVRTALQSSTFRHGKVDVDSYFAGAGAPVLAAIAQADGRPSAEVLGDLTEIFALQINMPYAPHRAAWDGGTNLYIAAATTRWGDPVVYDLSGAQVHGVSRKVAPDVPTIVLSKRRGSWKPQHTIAFTQVNCDLYPEECEGDGGGGAGDGGGGGGGGSPSNYGVWQMQIDDDYEGWLEDGPDFEVTIATGNSTAINTSTSQFRCVGQDFSSSSPHYWDYNDIGNLWTGHAQLLSLPTDASTFSSGVWIIVSENDDGNCADGNFPSIVGYRGFFGNGDDVVGMRFSSFGPEVLTGISLSQPPGTDGPGVHTISLGYW